MHNFILLFMLRKPGCLRFLMQTLLKFHPTSFGVTASSYLVTVLPIECTPLVNMASPIMSLLYPDFRLEAMFQIFTDWFERVAIIFELKVFRPNTHNPLLDCNGFVWHLVYQGILNCLDFT